MPENTAALEGVERVGRAALAEMRWLLSAMRDDGKNPELAPQPGLDGLDSLIEDVGRAGLPVRLHVTVRYGRDALQIEVRDDGSGQAITDGLGRRRP